MPRASRSRLQQLAGRGVELPLHQRRHQVDDRDRHAAPLQAPGRFEPEQAAADHDRAAVLSRRPASIASTSAMSRKARTPGSPSPGSAAPAASSRSRAAACRSRPPRRSASVTVLRRRIDRGRLHRRRSAGCRARRTSRRVDDDVVDALLAGQHRGQHDAVVVRVRLGAEHGDRRSDRERGPAVPRPSACRPCRCRRRRAAHAGIWLSSIRPAPRPGSALAPPGSSCACSTTRSARGS